MKTHQLRTDTFFRRIRQHPQLSEPLFLSHPFSPSTSTSNAATSTPPRLTHLVEFSSSVSAVQIGKNVRYPELRTPSLNEEGDRVSYEVMDLDRYVDSSEMTPAGTPKPSIGHLDGGRC